MRGWNRWLKKISSSETGAVVVWKNLVLMIGDWGLHAAGLDGIELHRNRVVNKE